MSGWFQRKPDEPDWTLLSGINFRKAGVVALILAVLGVAGRQGYQAYLGWHEQHLVSQAREFSRQQDIRSSLLNLHQVLALNPTNLAATRLMAELSAGARAPEAVAWRARLDELQPHNLENQLAWATEALRAGELGAARQALEKVDDAGRKTLAYDQVMGIWAFQAKHFDLAERYFENVLSRQRTNEFSQLNLALARLQSPRLGARAEAVAALEQLRRNPKFQTVAGRGLLVAAQRNQQPAQVLRLAGELKDAPQSDFQDQLTYLDALFENHHPEFASQLSQYQARAKAQPQNVFLLVEWLNARGLAAQALEWRERLTPEARLRRPIPIAMAESYRQLTNWAGLKTLVAEANWREFDCLRLANHALALDKHNASRESRLLWQRAVESARDRPRQSAMLARMVEGWGWTAQAEEVWWTLANGKSERHVALQALYRLNKVKRDTRQLLRVTTRIYQLNRSDLVAKNNLALFSLLLHQQIYPSAHQLALENYQTSTNTLAFLTTYAFSLHEQKRSADGLKLLHTLPEEQLQDPAVAAYYGLLLATSPDPAKARKYLERADQSPQILPEEQLFVREALRKLP